MSLLEPPVRTKHRSHRSKLTPVVATATTVALGLSGVFLAAVPASAAPGSAEAEGRFLSGTLLQGSLDELAAIAGERAEANSETAEVVTESGDLDLSVLGELLQLRVDDGVTIPLTIADGGVVSQYAQANQAGGSVGASGAVTDQGVIDIDGSTGEPTVLNFDLSDLLTDELTASIADVSLEAGAVTARAEQQPGEAATGDYNIASLRTTVNSPLVQGISGDLVAAGDELDGAVAGVLGPDGSLVSGLTSTLAPLGIADVDVSATTDLSAVIEQTLEANAILGEGGPVVMDLNSGEITVDIAALLEANGRDLNDLAPGEEILTTELVGFITSDVDELVNGLLGEVQGSVATALDTTDLTVSAVVGTDDTLSLTLDGTLGEVARGEVTPEVTLLGVDFDATILSGLIGTAVNGVLDLELNSVALDADLAPLYPALDSVLTDLVSLQANGQETVEGTFTQTALRLAVLNTGAPGELLSLNLAQAAVGPNAEATADISFTPTSGPEAGGTAVTISGEGFTGATGVLFGDTPASTYTVLDDGEILATTPAGTGSVAVSVVNAGGTTLTAPGSFSYIPDGGPGDGETPVVLGLTPNQGPEAGGTTVTITGENFTGVDSVTFDGNEAASFTVVSDAEITAVTPAGTGLVDVTIANGTATATLEDAFTYVPDDGGSEIPAVLSITPNQGPEAGGTTVTIGGRNLDQTDSVTFDGIAATSFTIVSDTEVTAVTPPGVGTVDVALSSGEVVSTLVDGFTYVPDDGGNPGDGDSTLVTINPDRGPEAGGTLVTIGGTNLSDADTVLFGDVPGTSVTVISDTEITVVSPAGTGNVPVTVSADGTPIPGDIRFTYVPEDGSGPVIDSVTPDNGPVGGGTVVIIGGDNFSEGDTVYFGENPGTNVVINSPTEITVTTPAGADPGLVDVTVISDEDESSTLPNGFEYTDGNTGGTPGDGDGGDNGGTPGDGTDNGNTPGGVYYENCEAVRDAGAAPLLEGEPGYRAGLDGDNDGIACENDGGSLGNGNGNGNSADNGGNRDLAKTGGSVAAGAISVAALSLLAGGLLIGFRRKLAN